MILNIWTLQGYYYYYYYYYYSIRVFHWSMSDSKSPQVSRTLLSVLAVLNNAVVWMVSTRPPICKSSSPFSNPLDTLPKLSPSCSIVFFFNSLARSRYLSLFSLSFSLLLWSAGTTKSTILLILFFLSIIIRSDLLAEIRWNVCMSKSSLLLLLLLLLFHPLRVFHISVNWWSFTGVRTSILLEWQQVTSSLQDSS